MTKRRRFEDLAREDATKIPPQKSTRDLTGCKVGVYDGKAMDPIELHDYVNQTRAAEILGISRMTLWQWLKDGRVQAVIVGGLRMIPRSELERLNASRQGGGLEN